MNTSSPDDVLGENDDQYDSDTWNQEISKNYLSQNYKWTADIQVSKDEEDLSSLKDIEELNSSKVSLHSIISALLFIIIAL